MNQICYKCTHKTICKDKGIPCAAISEYMDIYNADNTKVRRAYIRALARKLEIRDAEPSKELQSLGEAIINKFPELAFINSLKVVMLHELKHIQITSKGLSVRPHDVEDFKEVLLTYGIGWNEQGKELPDILSEGVE